MQSIIKAAACPWLPAAAFLLAAGGLFAAAPERIIAVEGVTEYRLDNGFKLLLVPDTGRPGFGVNIVYFVGSKHEGYGETGMAHLLEHMLFYGTRDHPDIRGEIAARGGMANAMTWQDRTNYVQLLPAGTGNLEWAIRMEADRMVNATIAADDLATEMEVVRREYEQGENSAFRVMMQRVARAAYLWHGYGRSTIGALSDIENVPIERLREFYRRHYRPDNAMLVLSGNFDERRALALVLQHFGAIPTEDRAGGDTRWPTYTREPVQDGEREIVVRRTGEVQLVMSAFHIPAALHEDFAAVEALSHVLGDAPSGRLHKALVETGLASRVAAYSMRLAEPGLLYLYAEAGLDQDIGAVRDAFFDAIADVVATPPTPDEVARAVNAMTRRIDQTLNSVERIGMTLSDWAADGDWRLMFLHRDRVAAITAEDLARVAGAYLKPANRTTGLFIPEDWPDRAVIPAAPDAETLLAGYSGRANRADGEEFALTAENIEARISRFGLGNGARVALLPKQGRGGRVHLALTMRIGSEDSLSGQGHVPQAVRTMLSRGTRNYTREQFSDRLGAFEATLDIGGEANTVTASIEASGTQLTELLELVAEMLKQPVFPERELEQWRYHALTAVDGRRADPAAVAAQLLARHFETRAPDHPLYHPGFDELAARIEAVTRDQLVDFHERFYGFGPGTTLAIVGDFDPEVVRPRLENLFGDWSPIVAFARISDTYGIIEPANLQAEVDDKPSATLIARQNVRVQDNHPDYPALMLGGHMLGAGFLSSRLASRVRAREGISYSIGAGFSIDPDSETGTFNIRAAFNPANRDRLHAAIMDELRHALVDGFAEDELEAAKRGWLQRQAVIRGDDSRLASLLSNALYLGRDTFYQQDLEANVKALSPEHVVEALRRHLDPSRLSFAEAGDFAVSTP